MPTKWVVDSNCFIHLGSMAEKHFLSDLNSVLSRVGETIYVADGVFDECKTVRFHKWKNKPLVMEELRKFITSKQIDEGQIRGLGEILERRLRLKMLICH